MRGARIGREPQCSARDSSCVLGPLHMPMRRIPASILSLSPSPALGPGTRLPGSPGASSLLTPSSATPPTSRAGTSAGPQPAPVPPAGAHQPVPPGEAGPLQPAGRLQHEATYRAITDKEADKVGRECDSGACDWRLGASVARAWLDWTFAARSTAVVAAAASAQAHPHVGDDDAPYYLI